MAVARPNPPPVLLVALILSSESELIEKVAARLAYEFGLAERPASLDVAGRGDRRGRWIALDRRVDPSQLAATQNHATRIEGLYADSKGAPRVTIEFGYVDEHRVVRAATADSPERIYLGEGVWGEIALVRREADAYEPLSPGSGEWTSPEAVEFLNAVAREGRGAAREDAPIEPAREGTTS